MLYNPGVVWFVCNMFFPFKEKKTNVLYSVKYNGAEGAVKYFRESFEINVVGNFNLYSLFTPLILKGYTKKILLISSGQTDLAFLTQYQIEVLVAYAANKAAHNVITAKFYARYAKKGVLFINICPGPVDIIKFPNCKTFFPFLFWTFLFPIFNNQNRKWFLFFFNNLLVLLIYRYFFAFY